MSRSRDLPIRPPATLATSLLELINHAIQIRIAGAKASGEPVTAALHDSLTIGQHFKLAGFARRNHGINSQPLFNHGRETRSLGLVALSRGAGAYLNFHLSSRLLVPAGFPAQCNPCKSVVRFFLERVDRGKMDVQLIANEQDQDCAQRGKNEPGGMKSLVCWA